MKTFGLLGWPIAHSLSPGIHYAAFEQAGLDWEYVLWPTKPEDLQQAMANFRLQKYSGANITIPHKETVISCLDGLTPRAEAIGAVNTLFWDGDKLMGDNTDVDGFLEDLCEKKIKLQNKSVLILGAGGSSKAIQYALKKAGARVKTWTRKEGPFPSLQEEGEAEISLIVHCTPGLDAEVLDKIRFNPGQVLYDLVYIPKITPLMQRALECGAKAFNGKGMLEKQAALSFEIWKAS